MTREAQRTVGEDGETFIDGPDPETLHEESWEGDNNAYRGTEMHGVPTPHYEWDEPDEAGGATDTLEDYDPQPDPVLVKLEPTRARLVNLISRNWPITDRPVQIVGERMTRVTVTLVNLGGNPVFIDGTSQINTAFNGFLPSLSSLTLSNVNGEIWCVCATGLSSSLNVFEEATKEER